MLPDFPQMVHAGPDKQDEKRKAEEKKAEYEAMNTNFESLANSFSV